ncbi:type 2 lanthipeptide synthetase LanM family protein [Corallococcus sp. bb12-1]|uniref:type 2 lanthipeptide synthetase LanM family protein n=1 Tax=Corallococcus sp. bb12-1 TaxID=2996784 RepID=UPI00226E7071|nr:type 2 lanthipeptide synthetase LanM family protein [Corallococcus sp. bb12-1]MCY1041526.1 type 2 lanthipeptide synthetase LanM family protein [Corallococcus sp. bb12-1]
MATEIPPAGWLARPVNVLLAPYLDALSERLSRMVDLTASERAVVEGSVRESLGFSAQLKLNRVLLLELHAAGLEGRLDASDPPGRWAQFLDRACTPDFHAHLRGRYPTLLTRLATVGRLQSQAVQRLVDRFVVDREALGSLPGHPHGALTRLRLGEGDAHRGGQTVALLELEAGTVMYKPRCMRVDRALEGLLARVLAPDPQATRIRVPAVLVRAGYGWAEFVEHRACEGETELARFYRNLGHWLAVMRLLGGTDLHSENLIAHGPVPVVVDVESLFTPDPPVPPSERGLAVDIAARAIRGTVLRTGLLPVRSMGPGLGGLDISAAGSLPGEQPRIQVPTIIEGGTDGARLGMTLMDRPLSKNHPSTEPVLARYWDQVVEGFRELTARLKALDAHGDLRPLLEPFTGAVVRRILRPTQTYAELMRMLWHPASLYDAPKAHARARDVMRRNADVSPGAPSTLPVIDEEIADLSCGDIPVFTVPVSRALLDSTLTTWRSVDEALEEMTIQSTLVSAYLNEKALPPRVVAPTTPSRRERLDPRRRVQLSGLVRRVLDAAVRGPDGTVTWISPVLAEHGWAVRPLSAELYSGQAGVAVCLAQYQHEVQQGRADPVEGLSQTLEGTLAVLRATEDRVPVKQPGGFSGLASQVWTWSTLHDLGTFPGALERARERAAALTPELIEGDGLFEVLGGVAGLIVPLLNLVDQTGEAKWLDVAAHAGRRLEATAKSVAGDARWETSMFPAPIGGFAHGTVGIGWALARLGLSSAGSAADRRRWLELSARAFDFVEGLYLPELGNWMDLRRPEARDQLTTWCHGSTGIGLAAADLSALTGMPRYRDLFQRARAAGLSEGFGWTHTLCHGDLGLWELLETGRRLAPDPHGPEQEPLDAELLSGLEARGPVAGMARDAFSPGLMAGLGSVIHTLLRMHPESRLASPLLLGRAPGVDRGSA